MAESKKARRVPGAFAFADVADGETPELRIELVDAAGERTQVVTRGGRFELDAGLVGKGYMVEVRGEAGGEPRRFQLEALVDHFGANDTYLFPKPVWTGWLPFFTCVTGSVEVCTRRWWLEPFEAFKASDHVLRKFGLGSATLRAGIDANVIFPTRCRPVCQGKVEVFVRTCCCAPFGPLDPPVIIRDICQIIHCPPEPKRPPKRWPWPGPDPDPGPFPDPIGPHAGVDMEVAHEVGVTRALKLAEATEGGPDAERIVELREHHDALVSLPLAGQLEYLQLNPELWWWRCNCTTRKVAEVPLHEDGHFDACFFNAGYLPRGCTRRMQYKVWQPSEHGWKLVYDGIAKNESFDLDDAPTLRAGWNATACDDPHEWGPVPFVLLESIGGTWADQLVHSTQQSGELSFAGPLAATDGLVNPRPAGPVAITAGPYDQPWGATLSLRYQFHPGMQALGARYYRTRVVRVDGAGQPVAGTERIVTTPVSWRKYAPPPGGGSGVVVEWRALGPVLPDTTKGLYEIPYPDLSWPWLGGQFHIPIDTTTLANGRYLFVVDVFNAGGQRLVPNNAGAAGAGAVGAAFEYRRLDGPIDAPFSNTSVVPQRALASLFYVDNLPAYGDIEQIVHGSASGTAPSPLNCQFLDGPSTDTLALMYSARQDNGFQWYHAISYKQGLTGPVTALDPSNANVSSGTSQSKTFAEMLGSERRCAFAAALEVRTRHTNGSGLLTGYWRYDSAAFALEQTP
jgi:hypothetical protein